jgi:carboxyl-terminal processing protease
MSRAVDGGGRAGAGARKVLLGAAAALAVSGCALRGIPQLPSEGAPTLTTLETLRRAEEMSLYPERLDRRFLVGALDAFEARFDSVRFDDRGNTGVLQVGSALAEVSIPAQFDVSLYLLTLARAIQFVDAHLEEERGPDDDLELIALRGGLFAIDKYATIFSGRSTEDFKIRFSGHLKGIGSTIGRKDGNLEAVRVFPDSPAERGGLKNGDQILSIDGESTQPLSVSDAVDRIRGEAGTVVVLGVRRKEQDLELRITRGDVVVPSVEARALEGEIGYARVDQVSRATGNEFRDKVRHLGELRGLVLDLRGNSGGAMSGAQQLADFFLDRQLIVRVVARGGIEPPGSNSKLIADPGVEFRVPIVVLVDPFTASAAEILSGALEPLGSVTLLGQTTFGKGVIQQVFPLQENLLKLTVAQYLLSADRVVDEVGIAPDIVLTPISSKQLGSLANVEPGSIPYVRKPDEEDAFPIEAARLLLTLPPGEGLSEVRRRASAAIAEELVKYGVVWSDDGAELPSPLPQPLRIIGRQAPLTAGRAGTLSIEVHNPNPFPVPNAWVALDGSRPTFPKREQFTREDAQDKPVPPAYLSNKLLALGVIPANGSATGTLELTPPAGVAASDHPISVSVASGSRPLHSERLVLHVAPQPPDLQVAVQRSGQRIAVALTNRGTSDCGEVLVDVEGASHLIDSIPPGESRGAELQLSGDAKELVVTLSGPWARRRISMPIPEADLDVVPPRVAIAPDSARGTASVHVEASDGAGLREGWIVLDDQKEAYVAWSGSMQGALSTHFDTRLDHRLAVKVEASSGVSVIEALELSAPAVIPVE